MTHELSGLAPRERILTFGPSVLSNSELLALIIGTGRSGENVVALADRILRNVGGLRELGESHPTELMMMRGVGAAKSARMFAAVELGRRICGRRWKLGEPFRSSQQVFAHYHYALRDQKSEAFFAAYLNARNRLIGEREVSRGSLVASIVHPREVFRPAIRVAAAAVICVHNHPSGDPSYSGEDLAITRRLHEVGETIGIPLMDHIIVGDGRYTSFVDQKIPPFSRCRVASGTSGP